MVKKLDAIKIYEIAESGNTAPTTNKPVPTQPCEPENKRT